MGWKKYVGIGLTALSALATLSACAGGGSAGSSSSTPVYGGTIVYGADREPTCLDPHNSGDMPQTYVARQYLDSLVSELPDGSVVPWLATSWMISPDGLTYTFNLRQGVRFTDGTPFNAAAVVANFTQELDPATESSTDTGYLTPYYASSSAVSEYVAQVKLKRPYSPLLDVLAQAFFGIESPKAMARGLAANCQSPVGTGPFIATNWVHGQSITLTRNPNYNSAPANAKHQGPAYVNTVTWRFLKEPAVRYAALTNGQVNLIFNVPPEDQKLAAADSRLSVQQFVHSGQPSNITLNATHGPFTDQRVREAFIYGSNAAAAVKSAYFGAYPAESTQLSSGTPDYDASLAAQYAYNPGKAGQLLDQASWTGRDAAGYRIRNGQELTVTLPYSSDTGDTPPESVTLLQDIQAAEKQIGVNLELNPISEAADNQLYATYNPNAYDALGINYWNSPTPAVLYIVHSPTTATEVNDNNSSYAWNDTLDNILLQAAATTDRTQQKELYQQAQQIAAAQAWQLLLYPVTTDLGINAATHGVWIEPSEGEPVLSDAWVTGS